MSTKHTPGPWLRCGSTIYALMHHGWRKGVEQFKNRVTISFHCDKECSDEEVEATGCLILAAPDLLEALKATTTWMEGLRASGDSGNWEWSEGDEYSRGIAAIAKATGEQK